MVFFSDRQGGYGSRADPLEKIVGPPGSQPPLSAVKSPGASGEQRQLPTGVVRPEGKNVHWGITLIAFKNEQKLLTISAHLCDSLSLT